MNYLFQGIIGRIVLVVARATASVASGWYATRAPGARTTGALCAGTLRHASTAPRPRRKRGAPGSITDSQSREYKLTEDMTPLYRD